MALLYNLTERSYPERKRWKWLETRQKVFKLFSNGTKGSKGENYSKGLGILPEEPDAIMTVTNDENFLFLGWFEICNQTVTRKIVELGTAREITILLPKKVMMVVKMWRPKRPKCYEVFYCCAKENDCNHMKDEKFIYMKRWPQSYQL